MTSPSSSTSATTRRTRRYSRSRSGWTGARTSLYSLYTCTVQSVQLYRCSHIPHLWRRQFCGMVVGLDDNIDRVVTNARRALGEDTIVIVSSDNGGAPHFGGLNQPLRSGKHTSFEGGVRVPAFALDLSGGKYLGTPGKLSLSCHTSCHSCHCPRDTRKGAGHTCPHQ